MSQKLFKKSPIVRLQGQPVVLFTEQHTSLLQALESKHTQIFSECRNGFCGACKTNLTSGEVYYVNEPLAVLTAGECLPCCCIPITDVDLDLSPKGVTTVSSYSQHRPSYTPQDEPEEA